MDDSLKILLLLLVLMMGVLILAFMILSSALGNIHNVLNRLEELIQKEKALREIQAVKDQKAKAAEEAMDKQKDANLVPGRGMSGKSKKA